MKRIWQADELSDQWTLTPQELQVIGETYPDRNKLGLAVLLKFFQHENRFPDHKNEVPKAVVAFLAEQLGIAARGFRQYRWQGRAMRRHRIRVREWVGIRKATVEDARGLRAWLIENILP